jgi:tetratricopeptide (TPR) repeat protein
MSDWWRGRAAALAVATVLTTLAVGLLTNILTDDGPPGWVLPAFLVAAAAAIATGLWGVHEARLERWQDAHARLDDVVRPFPARPEKPEDVERLDIVGLLDPRAGITRFGGRRSELEELAAWCLGDSEVVRVLDGPSGVGKTWLARELATRWLPADWHSGLAVGGRLADVVPAVDGAGASTLVVVDEADTRPAVADLVDAALTAPGRRRLRVLLVVRDASAFARRLAEHGPQSLARSWDATTLGVAGGDGDRRRWFADALNAYAPRGPRWHQADFTAVGAPDEPLMVTCVRAALAAKSDDLRGAVREVRGAGSAEIARRLVEHEQRRWAATLEDPVWGLRGHVLTARTLGRAVLALVLAAPPDRDAACEVLRRLRVLDGQPAAVLDAVISWSGHLYPASGAAVVTPTPDFLAAALVAACAQPDVDDIVSVALDQAGSLDALIRAAGWFPEAGALLVQALTARPDRFAEAAEAAVLAGPATRAAVGPSLVIALDRAAPGPDALGRLVGLVGVHGLGVLWVAIARRVAADLRSSSVDGRGRARLADALTALGRASVAAGAIEDALTADQEATEILRGLQDDENLRRPAFHLAQCLLRVRSDLNMLGRDEESIAPAREAVDLLRHLAEQMPADKSVTTAVAQALRDLGRTLTWLGRDREALAVDREALGIVRTSSTETHALTDTLTCLAIDHLRVGEPETALLLLDEALALHEDLPRGEDARSDVLYAQILISRATALGKLGRPEHAASTAVGALDALRELARIEPSRFRPWLAENLADFAAELEKVSRWDEAEALLGEAIGILREEVAQGRGDRYEDGLARALHGRAIVHRHSDHPARALEDINEAVALRQRLAVRIPERHRQGLARSLLLLSAVLRDLARQDDAARALEEATGLARAEATTEPLANTELVADCLMVHANARAAAGDHDRALLAAVESAAWWQRIEPWLPDEAWEARTRLVRRFSDRGRDAAKAHAALRSATDRLPPLPPEMIPGAAEVPGPRDEGDSAASTSTSSADTSSVRPTEGVT